MFTCPHCKNPISIWRKKDVFTCDGCGTLLKTNGTTTHRIANFLAGFCSLVFLVVPGIEHSLVLQILVLLAAYAGVYIAIIWFFFEVRLEATANELP